MGNTEDMKIIAILLVGHGSRLEYNKEMLTLTAEMMHKKRPAYIIKTCFLEYGTPDIPEGLSQMRREEFDVLLVVPLFLAKGVHVLRSIPSLLGLEPDKKTGTFTLSSGRVVPLVYAEPIGADELLADLMLKNADAALTSLNDTEY